MAEFEDKLGAILNDPQAMQQIMSLARSLGGGASGKNEAAETPSSLPPETAEFGPVTDDASPLSGLNLDPRLFEVGMKAISAYQDPSNEKAALLLALRPFVKEERYKKVDKAVQIARISKAIRAALDGLKGGEEGV